MPKIKDLKPGDFFTLREIPYPKDTQVFIRGEYDRSERKYWAQKWDDISDGKFLPGDREVFTDFIF